MKKQYLFALILSLLALGCSKEDNSEQASAFTLEVLLPEGTLSTDAVYISGPCFDKDRVLTPKYARTRTIDIDQADFVAGKTMEDGFWFVSEHCGRELDADGNSISHTMKGLGGYTYRVSVSRWTSESSDDITSQMRNGSWSLVGTLNQWRLSLGYPLESSGNDRIIRGVNCSGSDAFKLVMDGSWIVNFGYGMPNVSHPVSSGEITLVRDGGNIQPAAGVYTLTFRPETAVLKLEKTGEYMPEPDPDTWAVTGAYNGWDLETAVPLTRLKSGLYSASYVHLTKATAADGDNAGFLLAKNGSMEGYLGFPGGTAQVSLETETPLVEAGGNLLVPQNGYYDLLLDPENSTLTVMKSPAATMSSWSVVGKFNGWNAGSGTPFYTYGEWLIAFNVELTSVSGANDMGFKFVKNGSWDNNRGVSGMSGGDGGYMVVSLDTEVPLSQGGGNIQLAEEGTYDIYMNANTDKCFILKAGDPFLH